MLTDPDNAVEKKRIIVQIIINIEETAKNQGKTLEEVVDEFNSYVFNSRGENPDKCARDSTAANGVDLDIGARQERLGIVGSLFKSSEDYSDFRKMLEKTIDLSMRDIKKTQLANKIISSVEETAKNQGKTLEEVVDEFNSYVFNSRGENPDKCARDSIATNGVDLNIGTRQERLGIVGSLFKSSEDYSDFRKMLKDKLELLVNRGLLHALGLKNTSEISSANLNGFFNKSVPTPVANNDEDKLKSSPSKPTN